MQIKATFHPEGPVARNNFTLLKMLISRWGCAVPLPLQPVAGLIKEPLVKGATAKDKRGVLAKRSMGVKLLNAGGPGLNVKLLHAEGCAARARHLSAYSMPGMAIKLALGGCIFLNGLHGTPMCSVQKC